MLMSTAFAQSGPSNAGKNAQSEIVDYTTLPPFYDEVLIEGIRGSQGVEYFYDSQTYLTFLFVIPEKKSSTKIMRVIKFSVERLKKLIAENPEPYERHKYIVELEILSKAAMFHAERNKNILLIRYLEKLNKYVKHEKLYMNVDLTAQEDPTITAKEKERQLRIQHREGLEIAINGYLNRVIGGLQDGPDMLDYMKTRMEVTFDEIKTGHKIGNVLYIASPENRKKVHTVKILVPSEYAAEAVLVASEILLQSPLSEGVYFEPIRMSSKLILGPYEVNRWGPNILLTRSMCAALFQ